MKKRVLALLFGGALAVSLCACGGQPAESDSTDTSADTTQATEQQAEETHPFASLRLLWEWMFGGTTQPAPSACTPADGAVDEDSMVDKIDTDKVWRYEGDNGIIVFRFNPASLEFEGYTCQNDSDNMAPFRGTYTEIDGSLNLWYRWIFDDTGSTFHDVYGISFSVGRFSLAPVEGRSAISEEFGSDLMPFNVDKQTTASYLHGLIDDLIAGERYW